MVKYHFPLLLLFVFVGRIASASESLCGPLALKALLQCEGKEVTFGDFEMTDLVDSYRGSSEGSIARESLRQGVELAAFSGETVVGLALLERPAILRTRSESLDPDINHWVTFLGYDGHLVRISDGGRTDKWTVGKLLNRWDGEGLRIVSEETKSWVWFESRVFLAAIFLPFLGLIAILLPVLRQFSDIKQVALLVSSIGAVAITYHSVSPCGVIGNGEVNENCRQRFSTYSVPDISLERFKQVAHDEKKSLLVDARFSRDFAQGTIGNAMSLPVNELSEANLASIEDAIQGREVIVFCQSKWCGFSDRVAERLIARGASNVSIFRGGLYEWKSD
ncbi:MAG: rhodanese-like domain-containing protein [Planctomycetota bacterium]